MKIFLAIALPWLSFALRKKWFSAVVALIFQVLAILSLFPTGLGFVIWLLVAVWAVLTYQYHTPQNKKASNER